MTFQNLFTRGYLELLNKINIQFKDDVFWNIEFKMDTQAEKECLNYFENSEEQRLTVFTGKPLSS
jgi:hypothetical protein